MKSWNQSSYNPQSNLTPVVKYLLFITCGLYLVQFGVDHAIEWGFRDGHGLYTHLFGLWPVFVKQGWVWQLFTYMFLHSDTVFYHLPLNMFMLYIFGPELERCIGPRHFLLLYFVSGVLGGVGYLFMGADLTPCVGASGALFGLLGAFATLFPNRQIYIIFLPMFPFKAWVMALVLGFFQFVMMLVQVGNVAYSVHLAGGIAGFVYILICFRQDLVPFLRNRALAPIQRLHQQRSDAHAATTAVEVDRLLDKIAAEGIGSLTKKERDYLQQASRK